MRAHITKSIQDSAGNLLVGSVVAIYQSGTAILITDPLYTDETTSATLGNPYTSTDGNVNLYLDAPQRLDIGVTPPGGSQTLFRAVDAEIALASSASLVFPGSGANSTQVGASSTATQTEAVALGDTAAATGLQSTAAGQGAGASGANSSAIGQSASATGVQSTAVGSIAQATDTQATAVGYDARAEAAKATALGGNSLSANVHSTAVGADATTTADNQIMLGTAADTVVVPGALVGRTAGSAPIISLALTSGVAAQLADLTRDYQVYLQIGTAGTAMTVGIGHTSAANDVLIISNAVATAGELISFRVPAGWYVKWAATTATLANQAGVGC